MELALWRYFATYRDWGTDPDHIAGSVPPVFKSRIKKMLNMDRIPAMTPWEDLPEDQWIYYDHAGEGIGSEDRFSVVHVFLMGVALDLLNIGFKQSEVIFFLKHTRPVLENAFVQIHRKKDWLSPISGAGRQQRYYNH